MNKQITKLTWKQTQILTLLAAHGGHFSNGWRSAPGRPAKAAGLYINGSHVMSRAMILDLRDCGIVKQNWDVRDAGGCELIEVTALGREMIAAQAPKPNAASTRSVIRNLHKFYSTDQRPTSWRNGEVWEHLSLESVEAFRKGAGEWLRDRSELKTSTIESADWAGVFKYFRSLV